MLLRCCFRRLFATIMLFCQFSRAIAAISRFRRGARVALFARAAQRASDSVLFMREALFAAALRHAAPSPPPIFIRRPRRRLRRFFASCLLSPAVISSICFDRPIFAFAAFCRHDCRRAIIDAISRFSPLLLRRRRLLIASLFSFAAFFRRCRRQRCRATLFSAICCFSF